MTPNHGIKHLKNEKAPGVKNIHLIEISWSYKGEYRRNEIFNVSMKTNVVLYNISCDKFYERFINIFIVAYTACCADFELQTLQEPMIGNILWPLSDIIAGTHAFAQPVTELLMAS